MLNAFSPFKSFLFSFALSVSFVSLDTPSVAGNFQINPLLVSVQMDALETDREKLSFLKGVLKASLEQQDDDPQLVVDLFGEIIAVHEQAGQLEEASLFSEKLVGFAQERRERLDLSFASLYRKLGTLYEKTGQLNKAFGSYEAELKERQQGGQTGDALERVLGDLARLATRLGDEQKANLYSLAARSGGDLDSDAMPEGARGFELESFHEVDVYYATDRARTGLSDPTEYFGYGRGELQYGLVTVSIPDVHVPGVVEAPSVWRLEFSANPAKHVMVRKIEPQDKQTFFSRMHQEFEAGDKKEAVVFIHGFNVSFDAAAKRAAQLAYDMNYGGVPVLYSWPSAGKTTHYIGDTAVVRLSGRHLAGFLEDIRNESGADVVHIVAHSMGNRALTDALEIIALRNKDEADAMPFFGQVFFAAPDVDAGLFAEMAKTIRPVAKRLTLYTSEEDWALKTSKELHGSAMRAGLGGEGQIISPDFDTIDMTGLGTDMLSHSYFAQDSSALTDMMSLIWRDNDPDKRCGLVQAGLAISKAPTAWKYQNHRCSNNALLTILSQVRNLDNPDQASIHALLEKYISDHTLSDQLERILLEMTR